MDGEGCRAARMDTCIIVLCMQYTVASGACGAANRSCQRQAVRSDRSAGVVLDGGWWRMNAEWWAVGTVDTVDTVSEAYAGSDRERFTATWKMKVRRQMMHLASRSGLSICREMIRVRHCAAVGGRRDRIWI